MSKQQKPLNGYIVSPDYHKHRHAMTPHELSREFSKLCVLETKARRREVELRFLSKSINPPEGL